MKGVYQMLLSIVIGTIVWLVILAFLSRFVSIFATPMAWITSWFIVVFLVLEFFGGISSDKIEKEMAKELEILIGTWEGEDRVIGIEWNDSGTVNAYDDLQSYELNVYSEDGYRLADVDVDFLNKKCSYFPFYYESSNEFEYKLKSKKKLILTNEDGQEYVLKKKSKEYNKRTDRLTVEEDPKYINKIEEKAKEVVKQGVPDVVVIEYLQDKYNTQSTEFNLKHEIVPDQYQDKISFTYIDENSGYKYWGNLCYEYHSVYEEWNDIYEMEEIYSDNLNTEKMMEKSTSETKELGFEGMFMDEYSSGAIIQKKEEGYYIEYGIYRLTTFYGKGYVENNKLIFDVDESDIKMEFTLNSDGSELSVLVIESDFEYYPAGTTEIFPRNE